MLNSRTPTIALPKCMRVCLVGGKITLTNLCINMKPIISELTRAVVRATRGSCDSAVVGTVLRQHSVF